MDRNIEVEPQGYLASELKQSHSAERLKSNSEEEDKDTKIEPEIPEVKQPHSMRQRLSSAASDTKSESDGGYLASESSENPESEDTKTQSKRKNSNKDRHSARPPGSISPDSSDGKIELSNLPPVPAHTTTASDAATLVCLSTTQAQVHRPMCNTYRFSDNGVDSLSDGDYVYTQPCEEQTHKHMYM